MEHARSGKILVVDDQPAIRQLCRTVLEQERFATIGAENGREALDLYLQQPTQIGLILSDVSMPVMNGVALARTVFAHNPNANVILMTGFSGEKITPEDIEKLCAVLPKPFTATQLLRIVNKCLEYQERTHPSEVTSMQ